MVMTVVYVWIVRMRMKHLLMCMGVTVGFLTMLVLMVCIVDVPVVVL